MAKTELTKQLETAIQNETSECFGCLEVTIGWYGTQRVDFMTMDSKEAFRCYEIKISKSDFHSKHGHNFVGHYNYYVIPEELYESVKAEIASYIGVYVWNGIYLHLIKKAKRQELQVDINILKNSMIRSLYRDACKIKDSENLQMMNDLKKKLQREEKDNKENERELKRYRQAIYSELGRLRFKEFQDKYYL